MHEVNDMPLNCIRAPFKIHRSIPFMSADLPTNYTVNGLLFPIRISRQLLDNRSDKFVLPFLSRLTCYVITIAYFIVLLRQREHQNRLLLKQLEMYTR